MKVIIEFELDETWADYANVCDELLLEDLNNVGYDNGEGVTAKLIKREN